MKQAAKKKTIKPKVDHIYFVQNKDLKIKDKNGNYLKGGHDVVVTSINKKNNTVRVKTITSLEHRTHKGMRYDVKSLNDAKNGRILPIPIKELKSQHYSGIYHQSIVVSASKLNKSLHSKRFPHRYRNLIHHK